MQNLSHQQAEINTVRIGLVQIQEEVDPFIPTVLQTCHQSHTTTEHPGDLLRYSNKGVATMLGGSSTIVGRAIPKKLFSHFIKC